MPFKLLRQPLWSIFFFFSASFPPESCFLLANCLYHWVLSFQNLLPGLTLFKHLKWSICELKVVTIYFNLFSAPWFAHQSLDSALPSHCFWLHATSDKKSSFLQKRHDKGHFYLVFHGGVRFDDGFNLLSFQNSLNHFLREQMLIAGITVATAVFLRVSGTDLIRFFLNFCFYIVYKRKYFYQ